MFSGRYDTAPSPDGTAVSWGVAWQNVYLNAHSATSWSGQYDVHDGVEQIHTFWLLSTEAAEANEWAATQIGQDTFTRYQPTAEQITVAVAQLRRRHAHPAAAGGGED